MSATDLRGQGRGGPVEQRDVVGPQTVLDELQSPPVPKQEKGGQMQRLEPVLSPWMISPSATDLRLEVEESGVAEVCVTGFFKFGGIIDGKQISANEYARLSLRFQSACFSCLSGAESSSGVVDASKYEVSAIAPRMGETTLEQHQRLMAKWQSSGLCACSGFYSVVDSNRVASSAAFKRLGLSHWMVLGHDGFVEVVASKFSGTGLLE